MVKYIPDAVKSAVELQYKFISNIGEDELNSLTQNLKAERIGSYSFDLAVGSAGIMMASESMKVLEAAGLAGSSFAAVG